MENVFCLMFSHRFLTDVSAAERLTRSSASSVLRVLIRMSSRELRRSSSCMCSPAPSGHTTVAPHLFVQRGRHHIVVGAWIIYREREDPGSERFQAC